MNRRVDKGIWMLLSVVLFFASCAGGPAPEVPAPAPSPPVKPTPVSRVVGKPLLRIDPGGHLAHVFDLRFTADSRELISLGEDKVVRVWDLETGRTARTILGQVGPGLEGALYALALSPDEKVLAVGGRLAGNRAEACSIRLHDFESGRVAGLLAGHANVVNDLDFSPRGGLLASASSDRTVRLWDLRGEAQPARVLRGHSGYVYQARFSPDGRFLVSASDDRTLILWRVEDGVQIAGLSGHADPVRAAAWSPDGRHIVSGGRDKVIKLWDGRDGRFLADLAVLKRAPAALAFSPDGAALAVGGEQGAGPYPALTLAFPSGRVLNSFNRHDNEVLAVAISPDGRWAASAGGNSFPIFVRPLSGGGQARVLVGAGAAVASVGISPEGTELVFGRDSGPDNLFRLKDQGEWGLSSTGPLNGKDRFIRALHRLGTWFLAVEDGPEGIASVLKVFKDGHPALSLRRNASTGGRHSCFGFTPDGRAVISGGENGGLTAYDAQTGRVLAKFSGHESEVRTLVVSADGRRLVTGGGDQTIRLWNLDQLGRLETIFPYLTIFAARDGEWVAWTAPGYYACSLKGDRLVGWQVNHGLNKQAEFFPAERFSGQLHRPDVVSAVLETGDIDAAVHLASQCRPVDSKVDLARYLPPEVRLIQPTTTRLATTSPEVSIKALAQSVTGEPISEFQIFQDGRPVFEAPRGGVSGGGPEGRLDQKIKLRPGLNTFTLSAANRFARSNPLTLTVRFVGRPSDLPEEKPDLHVLAVGVSRYRDADLNLNYARLDAEAAAVFFEGQKNGLYRRVRVKTLLDEEATRAGIEAGLNRLLEEAGPNDLAVLFLAGHGRDNGRGDYYFLSHDARLDDSDALGAPWPVFREFLTKTPARVILLADTCRSGGITGSRRLPFPSEIDMTGPLKEVVASGTGVAVLAASTGRGDSKESSKWGHGAFTLAVLEGLRGDADYNRDRIIDLFELNLFVTHRVIELTGGTQRPTVEIPASAPSFPVAVVN
ncbi:MAG: caspase family protein [Pseudomonadota bacterium]